MSRYSIEPYKFFGYPSLGSILEYENIDYIPCHQNEGRTIYYVDFTNEGLTLFVLAYDNEWFNIKKCKDE